MSIYFLIESPDVKWRAVKKSVPQKNGAFYIPPVSRLNKKRLELLKSRLIKEKCDFTAAIPMKGDIDSLNVSVAAGVLSYEIVRQRLSKKI